MAEPSVELRKTLRRLKLSPILQTLPERATLARRHGTQRGDQVLTRGILEQVSVRTRAE